MCGQCGHMQPQVTSLTIIENEFAPRLEATENPMWTVKQNVARLRAEELSGYYIVGVNPTILGLFPRNTHLRMGSQQCW